MSKFVALGNKLIGGSGGVLGIPPVPVKYLKLQVLDVAGILKSTTTYCTNGLVSLRAFDSSGVEVPLSYYSESYQRTDAGNRSAAYLFDGDATTAWVASPESREVRDYSRVIHNQFYSADYGTYENIGSNVVCTYPYDRTISSYQLVTTSDMTQIPTTWRVYLSDDGYEWELVDRHFDDDTMYNANVHTYSFNLGSGIVSIFGKNYPVVTINGKQWMAANLDYVDVGLTVETRMDAGNVTYPAGWYYNNNHELYGSWGMIYNGYAVPWLLTQLEGTGWRLPHLDTDWVDLLTYAGGTDGGYLITGGTTPLRARSGKVYSSSPTGTNDYGFTLFIRGTLYPQDGGVFGFGNMPFWTPDPWNDDPDVYYTCAIENSYDESVRQGLSKYFTGYIRLVRDIE